MPRKNEKSKSSASKHSAVPPKAVAKPEVKKEIAAPAVQASVPQPKTTVSQPQANVAQPQAASASSQDSGQVRSLIENLRNFDADIARDAATSLGNHRDESAVSALIEVVANSNGYFHAVVRSAAAASLGQLDANESVDTLINALNDPIAEPSIEAIRALGQIGDTRAVRPLLNVTQNPSDYFAPSARRAAVLALARIGGTEAQTELRRIAGNQSEDAVIREDATRAVAAH